MRNSLVGGSQQMRPDEEEGTDPYIDGASAHLAHLNCNFVQVICLFAVALSFFLMHWAAGCIFLLLSVMWSALCIYARCIYANNAMSDSGVHDILVAPGLQGTYVLTHVLVAC